MSRFLSFLKNTRAIVSNTKTIGRQRSANSFSRMFGFDRRQSIYVSEIDTEKLLDKLEWKFGANFDVHMMHNVYKIRSPQQLTQEEIEDCR
ncbi:hypothetical protein BU25DRAFT_407893 [Macroventuria anomochaeta]|uniref:Uncharacterized protein n=1 Tax=Macroventuria anomochaeta TaxID=301207 RepID=A0ACB6S8K3_9PLEO|nr:uncharacterized protein BU25DRAFT_407893 [Macroventuria anomochaeta]KAF2630600.1 hypothetical protein BU25DRAFT_407893 [Macroventuria anomochaeta]